MSKVVSARISEDCADQLMRRAQRVGRKPGELAARYLQEGIVAEEYPGIVFVDGPAGRRAHIAGTGLDVWELVMLQDDGLSVDEIAFEYQIAPGLIHSAKLYAERHLDEIQALLPPVEAT